MKNTKDASRILIDKAFKIRKGQELIDVRITVHSRVCMCAAAQS